MDKNNDVSILDVTIRDGSYAINYQYSPELVGRIVEALDRAGIDYIEVSHGCGLGARENLGLPAAASDAQYVEAARAASKKAKIGVIAGGEPVTLPKDIDQVIDSVDFIRFAANCDNPRIVEQNLSYALKKRPDLTIFLQLMRSTRRPKSALLEAGKVAEAMGVKLIYLVDTAGHFLPDEVHEIVGELSSKLGIGVGFHGHDNLGLALANTLAAVRAGARSVDASLRGMGRSAGNAQLEALASLLKRLGHGKKVDLDALLSAGEEFIEPIMPDRHGIASIDLLTADANIDLYPVQFYFKIAEQAGVRFDDFVRTLGSDSAMVEAGLDEIRRVLTKLGADPVATFNALGFPIKE
jgi:4-hydroxy 2-oxovalerate aldolase